MLRAMSDSGVALATISTDPFHQPLRNASGPQAMQKGFFVDSIIGLLSKELLSDVRVNSNVSWIRLD
jgi:hypothetical protein